MSTSFVRFPFYLTGEFPVPVPGSDRTIKCSAPPSYPPGNTLNGSLWTTQLEIFWRISLYVTENAITKLSVTKISVK